MDKCNRYILLSLIWIWINNQSQFLLKMSLHRETCPGLHPEVLQHWHWAEHQDSRADCVPRVWVIRDKKQQQWRRSCQLPWCKLWGSHQGWKESVHWQWWKQEVSQNTAHRDFLNIWIWTRSEGDSWKDSCNTCGCGPNGLTFCTQKLCIEFAEDEGKIVN